MPNTDIQTPGSLSCSGSPAGCTCPEGQSFVHCVQETVRDLWDPWRRLGRVDHCQQEHSQCEVVHCYTGKTPLGRAHQALCWVLDTHRWTQSRCELGGCPQGLSGKWDEAQQACLLGSTGARGTKLTIPLMVSLYVHGKLSMWPIFLLFFGLFIHNLFIL